jgi:RimJ/RimL family protein N-acetyltransferase
MDSASVHLRSLVNNDALALMTFYNNLSPPTIRLFRPLGLQTSLDVCRQIVSENGHVPVARFDLVASEGEKIVGWAFVSGVNTERPELGLGVADDFQGQGIGTALLSRLMEWAKQNGLSEISLIVVKDNHRAQKLYQRFGFVTEGEFFNTNDQLPYFRMTACIPSGEE